jgi:hypothetical protein
LPSGTHGSGAAASNSITILIIILIIPSISIIITTSIVIVILISHQNHPHPPRYWATVPPENDFSVGNLVLARWDPTVEEPLPYYVAEITSIKYDLPERPDPAAVREPLSIRWYTSKAPKGPWLVAKIGAPQKKHFYTGKLDTDAVLLRNFTLDSRNHLRIPAFEAFVTAAAARGFAPDGSQLAPVPE